MLVKLDTSTLTDEPGGHRDADAGVGPRPHPGIHRHLHREITPPPRTLTARLNKGEAQNALKRAIFFHRTGRIRDHGLQAQGHRASALNLVAGAIVLWNTTYLEAAMRYLDRQGRPVPPDLLQHLSPLGWQHIHLTGDYLWSKPTPRDDELRPLRQIVRLPA